MKRCPACNGLYPNPQAFCPKDGRELEDGFVLDDKYRLENVIGEGGMGQVYRATHVHIGTQIAVKILKSELVSDPVAVERFRREARATARIRHQNVVPVTDFGVARDSKIVYLVMELLEGMSLKKKMSRGDRIPTTETVSILAQVCAALHAAHSNGIVHRDIKPDNIFLASDGSGFFTVKVLDFGLAKLRENLAEHATTLTNEGAILGTPCYMSPEQCMSDHLDTRSDIYSLGVVAYQMLTGKVPFPGPTVSRVLMQHCHEPPPPPRKIAPEIPVEAEAVILRSLAKQPADRQQTVREFFDQLVAAFSLTGVEFQAFDSGSRLKSSSDDWAEIPPEELAVTTSGGLKSARKPVERDKSSELAGSPTGNVPDRFRAATGPVADATEEMPRRPEPVVSSDSRNKTDELPSSNTLPIAPPVADSQGVPDRLRVEAAPNSRLKIMLAAAVVVVLVIAGLLAYNATQQPVAPNAVPTAGQPPPGMGFVPGGTLVMGDNASRDEAEKPEHAVSIKPFYIDLYEVTNEDFEKFVRTANFPPPPHWKHGIYPPGEGKFPVTSVSWTDAQAYALWAGKRLPTEAEWEWAARGDRRQAYPWGVVFSPDRANTKENRRNGLLPVGGFPSGVGPFGAFDLIGNAAEWTASNYEPYPGSKAKSDPVSKIIRGGDFRTDEKNATVTARFLAPPDTRDSALGFRCAKDQ